MGHARRAPHCGGAPVSAVLAAPVGRCWRVAPNPPRRAVGFHDWDAGPPAEWCELPPDVVPDAISGPGAALHVSFTPRAGKAGRRERQETMHELLGALCTRPAPHWSS